MTKKKRKIPEGMCPAIPTRKCMGKDACIIAGIEKCLFQQELQMVLIKK